MPQAGSDGGAGLEVIVQGIALMNRKESFRQKPLKGSGG